MEAKRLFLDANILLEILLLRNKNQAIETFLTSQDGRYCISSLSVHLCYHYCPKGGVPTERIQEFLRDFEILTMDNYVIDLAQRRYDGKDFENCLQAACAELGGCDEIVTLDKNFKKNSATDLSVTVI